MAQKLVVGLGNPGRRYARSRHNVGFRVAERLAARWGVPLAEGDFEGRFGRGVLHCADAGALDVAVLEPHTWMNLSGDAVAEAVATLRVDEPSRDLLIVSDDVDLPFGRMRLRPGGGAGGQRGLAHVIERLGTKQLPRLRFGVGRPPAGMPTADYVLQPFSEAEERALPTCIERAADAVERALCDGLAAAMDAFNRDPAAGAEPATSE